MLGSLIAYIREKKGLSKTNISDSTGINVGHLTHIEKGERNPSSKALRDLCKALEIPYQPISYTYDKTLTEDQVRSIRLNGRHAMLDRAGWLQYRKLGMKLIVR